jgi:hypothetical protein
VNDYPFTTRGVTVGHIVDKEAGTRYQVMDTPGKYSRLSHCIFACCLASLVHAYLAMGGQSQNLHMCHEHMVIFTVGYTQPFRTVAVVLPLIHIPC